MPIKAEHEQIKRFSGKPTTFFVLSLKCHYALAFLSNGNPKQKYDKFIKANKNGSSETSSVPPSLHPPPPEH